MSLTRSIILALTLFGVDCGSEMNALLKVGGAGTAEARVSRWLSSSMIAQSDSVAAVRQRRGKMEESMLDSSLLEYSPHALDSPLSKGYYASQKIACEVTGLPKLVSLTRPTGTRPLTALPSFLSLNRANILFFC